MQFVLSASFKNAECLIGREFAEDVAASRWRKRGNGENRRTERLHGLCHFDAARIDGVFDTIAHFRGERGASATRNSDDHGPTANHRGDCKVTCTFVISIRPAN